MGRHFSGKVGELPFQRQLIGWDWCHCLKRGPISVLCHCHFDKHPVKSQSLVPQMKWGEERKEGRGQLAGHWSKDNLQKQVFESEQSVELLVLCVCVWRGAFL